MITVWDIWVRLCHWSLALAVTVSLVSGKTGFAFYSLHKLSGEIVLTLIAFRIAWGFVGSSTARLLPLLKSPLAAISELRSLATKRTSRRGYGHNAAGGYATLGLLLLCAVQGVTGQFIADHDSLMEGRFHGRFGEHTTHLIHDIHHMLGGVLLAFVVIHIAMIMVYLLYAKTNLITPMITGRTSRLTDSEANDTTGENGKSREIPDIKPWWVGLLLAATTATLYLLVFRF